MGIILALAIYDVLAVRFRFMLWKADRLSQINTPPALIIPRKYSEWSLNLKRHGKKVMEVNPADRESPHWAVATLPSPCLLTASVAL
jgi:presenilin-like A22 family membrane protease